MNTKLSLLQPYPFERLRALLHTAPNPDLCAINLSIGEPKHPTPDFIKEAICQHLDGLSVYPPTKGDARLRETISHWIAQRYSMPAPNPDTQILPCLGSREALFSLAQTVVSTSRATASKPYVICPNPFYQIYEGATLLAGAEPYYANVDPDLNFAVDWQAIPELIWKNTQLIFTCSPGNPTGAVMPLKEWQLLFELSDRYGFVIASDECYSEIYFDDNKPIGALQAAHLSGRHDFKNIIMLSSLSKRSNVPGLRSGFVAGDAHIIQQFLLYRTYHGSAMSPVVAVASIAAWQDETHVVQNRQLYQEKFKAVLPLLSPVLDVKMPDASFYLWAGTPTDDQHFTKALWEHYHVTVLAGSFLARQAHGCNPGQNRIRIALVAPLDECIAGAQRIADCARSFL